MLNIVTIITKILNFNYIFMNIYINFIKLKEPKKYSNYFNILKIECN